MDESAAVVDNDEILYKTGCGIENDESIESILTNVIKNNNNNTSLRYISKEEIIAYGLEKITDDEFGIYYYLMIYFVSGGRLVILIDKKAYNTIMNKQYPVYLSKLTNNNE